MKENSLTFGNISIDLIPNSGTFLSDSQLDEIDSFFKNKYDNQMIKHNSLIEEYVLINETLNSQTADFLIGNSDSSENKTLETLFKQSKQDLDNSTLLIDIIQSQNNAFVECYSVGRDISYLPENYFNKLKLL